MATFTPSGSTDAIQNRRDPGPVRPAEVASGSRLSAGIDFAAQHRVLRCALTGTGPAVTRYPRRREPGPDMSASPDADLVLWHALYSLEARYWHDVDLNGGGNAHSFYTADGLFAVGDNEFRGREQIRQFYAWRAQRGLATVRSLRTTRHLISNLWVE